MEAPHLRIAQKRLAEEVITFLHGKEEFDKALKMSEGLFSGDVSSLTSQEIEICFKGVPTFELKENETLIDIMINNKIASSKREAREFLNNNAISINGKIETNEELIIDKSIAIDGKIIVIRRGKKKYYIGKF